MASSSSSEEEEDQKLAQIAHHVNEMLVLLGEDPTRDGLLKTPSRVAKSMRFLTSGMNRPASEVVNDALFAETSDEMVLVRDIDIFSLCEHHMLPFMGKVHVAYVPNGQVIGLSKLARIAELFGRRLQVQERLTAQIANALQEALAPRGVAVVMECTHMCMAMRGVQKTGATTISSCMLGDFKGDARLRSELLQLIGMPSLSHRSGSHGVSMSATSSSSSSSSSSSCAPPPPTRTRTARVPSFPTKAPTAKM